MPGKHIKDILGYPDGALHTTSDVAAFIGRTVSGVRQMVRRGVLVPSVRAKTGFWFSTAEVKRWLAVAALFKSKLGVPCLRAQAQDRKPQKPPGGWQGASNARRT